VHRRYRLARGSGADFLYFGGKGAYPASKLTCFWFPKADTHDGPVWVDPP